VCLRKTKETSAKPHHAYQTGTGYDIVAKKVSAYRDGRRAGENWRPENDRNVQCGGAVRSRRQVRAVRAVRCRRVVGSRRTMPLTGDDGENAEGRVGR